MAKTFLVTPRLEAQQPAAVRKVPLPPARAIEQFEIGAGLRIELAACEPQVIDPVAIQFDAIGRMWVVEMRDYPDPRTDADGNMMTPLGRIKILEDHDGDGFFESSKVFVDQLLFPTGLQLFRDGAIVTLAGEIAFFRDGDGDGVSDEKTTWFTGFEQGNEQLRANHPTYLLENQIHVASGLRGGTVQCVHPEWGGSGRKTSLSQRDLEFDPFTGAWRAVAGNSQFGFHQDSSGRQYVCSNRNPCEFLMAESGQVAQNALLPLSQWQVSIMPAAESSRVFPLVNAWTTSNLHAGQFTAACGVFRYESDLLAEQIGTSYFACEPTGSLLQQYKTSQDGFIPETVPAFHDREVLASRDPWFRPVGLVDGPEGAVYVVDMHRAVIEHPDWMPKELRSREDMRWGDHAGRIYRLVPSEGSIKPNRRNLPSLDSDQLVSLLDAGNRWERSTSGRLLAERLHDGGREEQSQIVAGIRAQLASGTAGSTLIIRGLWLLESIDALTQDDLTSQLQASSWDVRRQVVRLLARRANRQTEEWCRAWKTLAQDPHPAIRYQWLLEVAEGAPTCGALLEAAVAQDGDQPQDRAWIVRAVSCVPLEASMQVLSELARRPDFQAAEWTPLWNRLGWQGETRALQTVLSAGLQPADERVFWEGFVSGMLAAGKHWQGLSQELDAATRELVQQSLESDRVIAGSDAARMTDRQRALERLLADRSEATEQVCRMIVGDRESSLWSTAVRGLRLSTDKSIPDELVAAIPELPPGPMRSTVSLMIQHRPWTSALVRALEKHEIPNSIVDAASWQRLVSHPDTAIANRAKALRNSLRTTNMQELFEKYSPALKEEADLVRGKTLFKQHCATCHRIDGEGFRVGPEISDLRTTTKEQVLLAVLDPNAAIDAAYFRYVVLTTDGQILDGLLQDRQQSSVTLLLQEGVQRTIAADQIESIKSTGVSMMPTGLEQQLSPLAMRDVIAYVKEWRYLRETIPGVSSAR